ncbi:MAG: hypothetical protein DCF15_17840 [Phormidesmis priestleyi]|uniref:Na+-translocating membrane potential-generating system MpsC domain-containing protein n=1 Tax=Phormidesmis priestleyi TaxID=268141 RepID=A0A2W4YN86_9CYAN|nr:MAG: hypothetical protein DCF15_17840 [Phormidesmis priestleyi]
MVNTKLELRNLKRFEAPLENEISQLYFNYVGHHLSAVSCTFLQNLELIIFMEGTRSPLENFLETQGDAILARRMRDAINQIIKGKLYQTIERGFSLSSARVAFLEPTSSEKLSLIVTFNPFEQSGEAHQN